MYYVYIVLQAVDVDHHVIQNDIERILISAVGRALYFFFFLSILLTSVLFFSCCCWLGWLRIGLLFSMTASTCANITITIMIYYTNILMCGSKATKRCRQVQEDLGWAEHDSVILWVSFIIIRNAGHSTHAQSNNNNINSHVSQVAQEQKKLNLFFSFLFNIILYSVAGRLTEMHDW